jgi:hypothetical protein
MAEIQSAPTEMAELPPLPASAWSLETVKLYDTKPKTQISSQERGDANLEQCKAYPPYQTPSSRKSSSSLSQPLPELQIEMTQRRKSRRPRYERPHSSSQDSMREESRATLLTNDRRQERVSAEAKSKGNKSISQKSQSNNLASRTPEPDHRHRCHKKGPRGSHSRRRRSSRKQNHRQQRAPSYTILQWILWKLC